MSCVIAIPQQRATITELEGPLPSALSCSTARRDRAPASSEGPQASTKRRPVFPSRARTGTRRKEMAHYGAETLSPTPEIMYKIMNIQDVTPLLPYIKKVRGGVRYYLAIRRSNS